jgi:hypothetical protein
MQVRRLVGNFFDLWKAYAGYQHLPGAHEPFPRTENIIKNAMLKDERVIRVRNAGDLLPSLPPFLFLFFLFFQMLTICWVFAHSNGWWACRCESAGHTKVRNREEDIGGGGQATCSRNDWQHDRQFQLAHHALVRIRDDEDPQAPLRFHSR